MGEFTVKKLEQKNIAQMTELFSLAFNMHLKPEVVQWKYFDNPAGEAIWMGIFSVDKLVGSGAMVTEVLNVFGKSHTVYKCTDLMIHPAHQGKGLASLINAALREQVWELNPVFSYTLCSKNATSNFLKNGWINIGGLSNFFKPTLLLKASHFINSKPNKNIRKFTSPDGLFENYAFKTDNTKINAAKSAKFMHWRTQNPNFSYFILGHFNHSEMDGYLIYSVGISGIFNLIDLEAVGDDKQVYKNLLKALEIEAVQANCKGIVGICLESNSFYNILKSQRYLKNPFKKGPLLSTIDFNILSKEKPSEALLNIHSWEVFGLLYDDV